MAEQDGIELKEVEDEEMATARNSTIEESDGDDKTTPLHNAARNGHLAKVKQLLDRGADITAKDENDDTPVHFAAMAGHAEIVKEMIRRYPQCVNYLNCKQQTPLHLAAEVGHFEVVQTILNDHDPRVEPDVNAKDADGDTPLSLVGFNGSIQIATLLVEKGAEVDPPLPDNKLYYRSPFHNAGYYGQTELALYLLKKGAKVSGLAFYEIVHDGYEDIAAAVVKSSQWAEALRYTDPVHKTTPLRLLIKKMPAVAEAVLNKCAVEAPKNLIPSHGDPEYSVVYNHEFLEDFGYRTETGEEETDNPREKKCRASDETDGTGFKDILNRDCKGSFNWGPKGFSKSNHPLAIMVRNKCLNLLSHPVVGSLLHHKWNKFGLWFYLLNLFAYFVFLSFLTAFALEVPNPQADICQSNVINMTGSSSATCLGISDSRRIFLYIAPAVVILLALILLAVEVAQLVIAIKSQLLISITSYLTEWVNWLNWMEIIIFLSSIIFVWVYNTECQCALNWQWQVGVIAVFLGWIDLIIFISKFPLTGVYVLMFTKILYTFLKMILLAFLLVIAFGLSFYMVFFDPAVNRSPFSDPPRSLLKTMTWISGGLDFNAVFRVDPAGRSDSLSEIAFLPVSVVLWIVFVILIPILLRNMLTGLAVADIKSIQKEARLRKLALQVDQVLTIEELFLTDKLRRWFRSTYKEVYPNRKKSWSEKIVNKISFVLWGGDHYDNRESMDRAFSCSSDLNEEILQKTNDLVEQVKENKRKTETLAQEVNDNKRSLVEEINEIKMTLKELKDLQELIAKKNGIDVAPDIDLNSLSTTII